MIAIIIIVLSVILDRISKILVVSFLKPQGQFLILNHIIQFSYVENKGAAFGILENQRWIFIAATLIMILVLSYALYKKMIVGTWGIIGVALIIGGGIGNLIDRIFQGYVVDFIDFKLIYFICPAVFNVADMCVVIGAFICIIWLMFLGGDIHFGKKNTESN